jgi:hypothetical protein
VRLLHEVRPEEVLVCEGEYRYSRAGQPTGQAEQWQVTRLPNGSEITRVELTGKVDGGPFSLLTHLQRLPSGRPEWLRLRYEAGAAKAAAQYTFEDAVVRIARQAVNQPRQQELLEIATGYEVDYHPVVGHDYVWRAYPSHARGKPWSIPVFSPNLWAEGRDVLTGRALRFYVKPMGAEDLSTPLGDFEGVRAFEVTFNDEVKSLAWFDEFGVPLRWAYPDKSYDFVLVSYSRPG